MLSAVGLPDFSAWDFAPRIVALIAGRIAQRRKCYVAGPRCCSLGPRN